MNVNNKETFLTTSTDDKQLQSSEFNDEEMDIDIESSTSSEDTPGANIEADGMINKNESEEISSFLIPHVKSVDVTENKMLTRDPSTSIVVEPIEVVIPKAVYDYAAMVNHTLEGPRENKLDHDVTAILGTSDPPPGFGFLHPRFYYLEQQRPIPLEPLQVWRGYNGHVYFSPIQVQQLDSDRAISPAKSLKSITTPSVSSRKKPATERSNTRLSAYKTRKSATHQTIHTNEGINTESSSIKNRAQIGTTTNAKKTSNNDELQNQALVTLNDNEDYKQQSSKMWQSVVTSAHVRVKPISKRSQHVMEDLQALQQEQSLHDPTGYNRQVLPNIRPVAKSKFVYKGLAYKESQKLPGIIHETDNEGHALQKPLVAYNLAQAYARYEINAARAKQNLLEPPPSASTGTHGKNQPSPLQTSLDLREMRKRIVRGTTLAYRPPAQTVSWTPGRVDRRSTLGSEITYHRPSTSKSKSSIPQKQTTVVEMPVLTKNINQPENSSRYTPTTEIIAAS